MFSVKTLFLLFVLSKKKGFPEVYFLPAFGRLAPYFERR